ncbi:hypothetical protein LTS15_008978 [Exophiala xenobiotica]|nr:hypothetical protein LTS15_008978 [Exophiala xenobiotica]
MKTDENISDVERGSTDSSQKKSSKSGFFSLFFTRECSKSPSPDEAQNQEKAKVKEETWRDTEVLKGQPQQAEMVE